MCRRVAEAIVARDDAAGFPAARARAQCDNDLLWLQVTTERKTVVLGTVKDDFAALRNRRISEKKRVKKTKLGNLRLLPSVDIVSSMKALAPLKNFGGEGTCTSAEVTCVRRQDTAGCH